MREQALRDYLKLSGDVTRSDEAKAALARSRTRWHDAYIAGRIKQLKTLPARRKAPAADTVATAEPKAPAPSEAGGKDATKDVGGWGTTDQPETAEATAAEPVDPEKLDPLSSPEALAIVAQYLDEKAGLIPPQERDDWDDMTSLQRQAAYKEYKKNLEAREQNGPPHAGSEVTWDLRVKDIKKPDDGKQLVLLALSEQGFLITAYVAPAHRKALLKYRRHDPVCVQGTLTDYKFAQRARKKTDPPQGFMGMEMPEDGPVFGVLLTDASVSDVVIAENPEAIEKAGKNQAVPKP
jgi:hypothetical protein